MRSDAHLSRRHATLLPLGRYFCALNYYLRSYLLVSFISKLAKRVQNIEVLV